MQHLSFDFRSATGAERREVVVRDLIIAGWTGRDQHKLQEHIAELAALGVTPPATTPCFYRASASLLTTGHEIQCLGTESSGEAEFFILLREDGWWVGLGSDHTDRKVEAYSVAVSKQMCAKPVADVLWRFDDVAEHWDRLEISAEVEEGSGFVPYQHGSVAAMRDPRDLIATFEAEGHRIAPDTVIFGGTLPVIGGIRPRRKFRAALSDQIRGTMLGLQYNCEWIPD